VTAIAPSTTAAPGTTAAPATTGPSASTIAIVAPEGTEAPSPKGACSRLDPTLIRDAVGLDVQAGKPTPKGDQCLWISSSGSTSPALAKSIAAFAPLSKALSGVNVDTSAAQAAAKAMVVVTLYAIDDPVTNEPSDADPEEGLFVKVPGVGVRAAVGILPQEAGSGVAIGFVQIDATLGMIVQTYLAATPTTDQVVTLMKAAVSRG
jgi:hypothetical protein